MRSQFLLSFVLFAGCATAVDDISPPVTNDARVDSLSPGDTLVTQMDTSVADTFVPDSGTDVTGEPEVEVDSGPCGITINELQTGDASSGSADFVELYNSCSASRSVDGYKLVYRSASGTADVVVFNFPSGTTIAARGFFVVGGSAFSGSKDGSLSSGLAVGGGGIGLRDAADSLVDSVGYGTATNAFVEFFAAPAPGDSTPPKSIGRKPDGRDRNDNGSDFAVMDSTPGAPN